MIDDIAPDVQGFELLGHDCPLGEYPSVAVPVGRFQSEFVAVYASEAGPQFQHLGPDTKFNQHNRVTAGMLRGFNPLRHGLFALDQEQVIIYEVGREKAFYSRLLRCSPAFYIEPFYRLSLALETEEMSLIRPVYFSCTKHIMRDAPQFIEGWMKAVERLSPVVTPLRDEWFHKLDAPVTERSYVTTESAAAPLVGSTPDDLRRFRPSTAPEMSSATIDGALRELTLGNVDPTAFSGVAYSSAIRASLGFSELGESAIPVPEAGQIPSADAVSATSGLSLPHLEFRNIILSRSTALQFLRLSDARLPVRFLLDEVLRPEIYQRYFQRPAVRIKRRQVFTYAEILSLVGFAGQIEKPSWL